MVNRFMNKAVFQLTMCAAATCAPLAIPVAHAGTVPAVVAESAVKYIPGYVTPTPLPSPLPMYPSSFVHPGQVAVDSNGNMFVADFGGTGTGYTTGGAFLWEVPAGSTTPVVLAAGLGGNSSVAVDASNDVIVTNSYNGAVFILKNTNGTISTTPVNISNIGGLDGYYASFTSATVVNGSTVYAATSYANNGNNTAIYSFSTTGTNAATFLTSLPGGVAASSVAGDNFSHLYYTDGTGVYVVSTASPTPTPTRITNLVMGSPGGVSTDAAGNLYITDKTNSRILEVPNEGGTLNTVDQFIVANTYDAYPVGIDPQGNLYYTDSYNTNSLWKITRGAAAFATTATGTSSASVTVNFIFNFTQPATPVTPAPSTTIASIGYYQGTGTSKEFTLSYGTCATAVTAKTAFTEAQSCTAVMIFKPTESGVRTGAIVLQNAAGKALDTAYLYGIGSAPGVTVDPGTQTTLSGLATPSTSYQSPTAAAYDGSGNLYVSDASLNTVLVTPAGTAAASLSIGTGLSLPGGVTTDAAGNVFVADTGNNRVVEIPNEAGTLNSADQTVVLSTGLSGPTGIRASLDGSLYVVDAGNKRVLRLLTYNGPGAVVQSTLAIPTTLQTPAGVTTDSAGNVYVSDSTGGSVYEINPLSDVTTVPVGSLSAPSALGVDAAGDLYIVSKGNFPVAMYPNVGGVIGTSNSAIVPLTTAVTTPVGLALDALGNVAIADGGASAVYRLARTQGAVNFGNINIQLSSTPQQVTLTSAGTLPLVFNTPYATETGSTADFQQQSPANSCASGETVATGSNCVVSVVFAPITINSLSETYTFSSNAVNATSPTATFSGFATNLSLTNTVLARTAPTGTGNPNFGQTVTVTATVTATRSGYTPTGTVTFYLDGNKAGVATLTATSPYTAVYSFSVAQGNQLSAGTHVITASYGGDANNAASSATTPLNVTVTQATATVTLAVVPTWAVNSGSSLYFNITVTPPVAVTPTGTITLYLAGTTTALGNAKLGIGTGTTATALITVLTSATTVANKLTLGNYNIVAVYSGDGNYVQATSSSVAASVQNRGFTVAVANNNLTVKQGNSVSTTFTVTTVAGYGFNTYVPANGATPATTDSAVISNMCSTLPSYATCVFSPGQELVNSYNVNDQCAIVSTPTTTSPTGNCLYNEAANTCVAVPNPTSGQVGYCSDPNFPNTYTGTLTITTNVVPPISNSGLDSQGRWPFAVLSIGLLTLLWRKRRRLPMLAVVLLALSAGLCATGCGSGTPTDVSPAGSTGFSLNFVGQTQLTAGTSTLPNITQTIPMTLTITN
jgi:hypothetical protein